MKLLFLSALSLSLSFALAHEGIIEEEFLVTDYNSSLIEEIQKHPDLTIDHMDQFSFELYGPKGTGKWLSKLTANFAPLTSTTKEHHTKDFAADYPSFAQVTKNLRSYVAMNPKIAKMFSIGKSVEGRDLWVVKISDNVDKDEVEPEFKYISSMHGNEITGRELTQFFIKDLISGYGKDKRITDLINNTEIFIMPSMNPDGSKRRQRANARGYDLNRNFPDWENGDENTTKNRQPETVAVMNFQAKRQFALSANFHGGAVVVNYPWDSTRKRHPFDKLIKELSLAYADENPGMRNSRSFSRGITNGYDWYELHGGMQDWSYNWHNDLQVTLEVSRDKWPRYSEIPSFYKDNKESMLVYMEAIHQGAGFKLPNQKSGSVTVFQDVNGKLQNRGTFGFQKGEFYKYLSVGEYIFKVKVNGEGTTRSMQMSVDKTVKPNGNILKL
ncbi:MAG: hypothetical protein CME62_03470 [Halobacteriovoraceae bacterium]|nr:hypothetical protein [Halobacteriovoraceae bacterium]